VEVSWLLLLNERNSQPTSFVAAAPVASHYYYDCAGKKIQAGARRGGFSAAAGPRAQAWGHLAAVCSRPRLIRDLHYGPYIDADYCLTKIRSPCGANVGGGTAKKKCQNAKPHLCSGVAPSLAAAAKSAPRATSAAQALTFPAAAARCSGVSPDADAAVTLAPAAEEGRVKTTHNNTTSRAHP
jgi:hypothetical protein